MHTVQSVRFDRQIFLNENFEPLIDYSPLSKIITDPLDMTMTVGTPRFMAPELLLEGSETYGLPVDVYAFAFILYRMFAREITLDTKKLSFMQLRMNIIRGKRPIRQNNIPDCYWQLIERCWKQKPEERPAFAEITEILKDDQYVLHDCGEPDLNEIHRYRNEIDN